MFRTPLHASTERWVRVDLENAGSFEVLVRQPTWGELLADSESFTGYAERRLRTTIVNWHEVIGPDDQPLPFRWETLTALCERYPRLFGQLVRLANEAYRALPENAEKNSLASPVDSSAAATMLPQPSSYGAASEALADFATPPA